MKTKILTGLALIGALSVSAQQQQSIIDLRTGIYDVPPANMPSLMPIGLADDTWKVYRYVNGNFQSLMTGYVSNGHEISFMPSCAPSQNAYNWSCSYQSIDPDVRVLAPDIFPADVPDPGTNNQSNMFDKGDIKNTSTDQYLYRMTFDFGKTCNSTIQSAFLNIKILTGDGITGFYINGHYVPLPNYPQMQPSNPNLPYTNYLNIDNALYVGNNYNNQYPYTVNSWNGPFSTYIPAVSVPIPAWYFSNGSNTLIIAVNPSSVGSCCRKNTAALMVDAELEINHTPGVAPYTVTPSGPVTLIHTQTQLQSVTVTASTGTPGILMQLFPGNVSGVGPTTISSTYTPMANTTLFVKVIQPSLGCGDDIKIPVTVIQQRPQHWMSLDLSQSTKMLLQGSTGIIMPMIDDQNAGAYSVKVQKDIDGDIIYEGPPNVDVAVSPGETRDYIITVRDPDGDETMHFWTMEVYQADIFDGDGNSPYRLAQQAEANKPGFSMNVLPNPSTGVFVLNTATPLNGALQVIDVTGKQIYQAQLTAENSNYAIDLTNFASGIYMLIVNSDQGHFESKLIRE